MIFLTRISCFGILTAVCFFYSCNKKSKQLFQQLSSAETGIAFTNHVNETEEFNILTYPYQYNGGGVAVGDINKDGLEDLFFTGNQKNQNKLYLNKGNFKFDDITEKAGVKGKSDWCNGVAMVDINGDEWLDIYISTVTIPGILTSANELYINNHDGTFTESAAAYGLNFSGHTTQSVFFDYDLDGDLDCFFLNHSVTYSEDYKTSDVRNKMDPASGDKLFQNNSGKFTDVTQQAGIYSSAIGYGLGISVGDLNNDGWPDIYVSNDFKENDYCYINNGNGTFTERITDLFGHTSRFSMGNDMADYNNDGWLDMITMDMLSQDEKILKTSVGDDDIQTYDYKHKFGFHFQVARNCLQQNVNGRIFNDVALQKGVAATDWSWAPLFADFDNDGKKDLYISNGYKYRVNDQDFSTFFQNKVIADQKQSIITQKLPLLKEIPKGEVPDYLFMSSADGFTDASADAGFTKPNLSNGAVYADLDNDGDLDLAVNRMDAEAGIYKNNMPVKNYLTIKLKGDSLNTSGIGAMVYVCTKDGMQLYNQSPVRGFMSSVSQNIHIGLGEKKSVDSLVIIWPDGKGQRLNDIAANKQIELQQKNASTSVKRPLLKNDMLNNWADVTDSTGINFIHKEDEFDDLNVQPFLPHSLATQGPKTTVADVNADGVDDIYIGGAKNQPGQLFIQTHQSVFIPSMQTAFVNDSAYEDADALFFDADGDKDNDLYVASGGNELFGRQELLKDRLYLNDGKGNFTKGATVPELYENKSCVRACDFDKDGDLDLFVGGRANARMYGYIPASVILVNDGKGNFKEVTEKVSTGLMNAGMVTDAHWSDIDKDGWTDLIAVGEWMPITVFKNKNGKLIKEETAALKNTSGWWTCIYATDIDDDGDEDYLMGNWGTNTRLRASAEHPLNLYIADWDKNNEIDPILSIYKNDAYYTFLTKMDLDRRLPYLKKKFFKFNDIAGKTTAEIFGKDDLQEAKLLQASMLESCIMKNENGKFTIEPLPSFLQMAPVFSFTSVQTQKGKKQYIAAGNFYEVLPYEGRYDAFLPTVFSTSSDNIKLQGCLMQPGEIRKLQTITLKNGETILLLVRNNNRLSVVKQTAGVF